MPDYSRLPEAALNWLVVLITVALVEASVVILAYYRFTYEIKVNDVAPSWIKAMTSYLIPEIWKRKQTSVKRSQGNLARITQKRGNQTSTQADFSMISNVLQTLAVQDQNELSLPGFLELESLSEFTIQSQLARGGAGTISLAEMTSKTLIQRANGRKLAVVKQIHQTDMSDALQAAFCQEVSMMYYFRSHPNFALLYGFAFKPLTILMKHYPFGSLAACLFKKARRDANVTTKAPLKSDAVLEVFEHAYLDTNHEIIWSTYLIAIFFKDMAEALKAMHDAGIVHNDIKPDNVLIDFDTGLRKEDMNKNQRPIAVVTDLGISQIFSERQLNIVTAFRIVKITGSSAAYCGPEVFLRMESSQLRDSAEEVATALGEAIDQELEQLNKPMAIIASDCYSLGVTAFEMLNKRKAWRKIKTREEVQAKVFSGERPAYEDQVLLQAKKDVNFTALMALVDQCWLQDPFLRPKMADLITKLDVIIAASKK